MQTTKTKNKSKLVPLVLATSKPYSKSNLPAHEVASYKCNCGHKGAVQVNLDQPHCAKCGNVVTARITTSASVGRIENAGSLVSLECSTPKCSAHNLMATATAVAFAGSICCASCGTELAYDTEELDDSDVDLDNQTGADDLTNSLHDPDDHLDDDEEASFDDDDVDIEDLDETANNDDVDDEADDYLGGDSVADSEGKEVDSDSDEDDDSALDGDDSATGDNNVTAKVKRSTVLSTFKPEALETARIVAEPDRLHLFVKNACVATLIQNKENASVFGSKNHIRLINSSLANKGVAETAQTYGFTLATYKVDTNKALEATVASIEKTSARRLTKKLQENASLLRESLEIAALGYNRDAYATETAHPIKDSIMDLLVGMGVDKVTAAFKVQEAFANSGDAFVEALITKAQEIASLPPTVRSQLASTFATISAPTPNLHAITASDMDDDEDDNDFDSADDYLGSTQQTSLARLESPMKKSKTAVVAHMETAAPAQSKSGSLFAKRTLSAFSK